MPGINIDPFSSREANPGGQLRQKDGRFGLGARRIGEINKNVLSTISGFLEWARDTDAEANQGVIGYDRSPEVLRLEEEQAREIEAGFRARYFPLSTTSPISME